MILVAKGKDKKSRKHLKQSFGKIFLFLFLSIFQQTWVKLLHSVQKRYTTSPSHEVQKWVTTVAPTLQCLRSKNLSGASRSKCCKDKLSDHAKTQCFSKTMVSLSANLPILRFLEKIHVFFLEMAQLSGDLLILKFLENSTLYQKMVSISGDLPTLKFLKNSMLFQ